VTARSKSHSATEADRDLDQRIDLRLPWSMKTDLQERAERDGVSLAAFIRTAIRHALGPRRKHR